MKYKFTLYAILAAVLFSLPLPGLLIKEGLSPSILVFSISFSGSLLIIYSLMHTAGWDRVRTLTTFFIGYYLLLFYWVTFPIEDFTGIPSPWSHLMAIVFFIFNFGHYYLLLLSFYLTRKFHQKLSRFEKYLVVSLLTAGADNYFPQILPFHLGNIIINLPSSQNLLNIGGTPFITFVFIFASCLILSVKTLKFRLSITVGFFVCLIAGGKIQEWFHQPTLLKNQVPTLQIVLVQPNISNVQKIASEKGKAVALREIIQTLILLSKNKPGILIWPETAIPVSTPFEGIKPGPNQSNLYKQVLRIRADLISGTFFKDVGETKATNSLFIWSKGTVQRYDKGVLKPFAEEFPVQSLSLLVKEWFGIEYELKRGINQNLLDIHGIKFIGLICYESLKPNYIKDLLNKFEKDRPQFILNAANDGWFGDSSELSVHFFMNRVRSHEFSLPVVRVANTGVTGVIYPDSSLTVTIPRLKSATLSHELRIWPRATPLYQKLGFLSTLIISVLIWGIYRLIKMINLI